jgi:FkbM family methyltransferase
MVARKGRLVWHGDAGGEPELRLLPALCDPRKASVDVGANEGGYAWHMRRFSRGLHVFEPLPELALRLSRGFALDHRVHVHPVALSDQCGTTQLRVPASKNGINTGLATIEPANSLPSSEVRRFTVPVRTLDSYTLRKIGFIKIDVEGHELAVLHGATELIEACRPAFLIEAQETHRTGAVASVTALLAAAGYRGLFLHEGRLFDIADFNQEVHQGGKPGGYFVNNFLFVTDASAFRRRAEELLDASPKPWPSKVA